MTIRKRKRKSAYAYQHRNTPFALSNVTSLVYAHITRGAVSHALTLTRAMVGNYRGIQSRDGFLWVGGIQVLMHSLI